MEIDDAFKQLGAYGLIIKMLTDAVQGIWKPRQDWKIKALVVAFSALAVYVFRVIDPVGLLEIRLAGLHEIVPAARKTVGVAILAGSSMGVHDVMDYFKNAGHAKKEESTDEVS
jgi:hypothetical protein